MKSMTHIASRMLNKPLLPPPSWMQLQALAPEQQVA